MAQADVLYHDDTANRILSLIHTCELNGVNPWNDLQALVRHRELLAANPAAWMPWNYQQTVESLSNPEPVPAAAMREAG